MHFAVVVNPTSGKQQGESIAAQAAERLSAAGHSTVRAGTDELDREIAPGVDGVLVVGGDGALRILAPPAV